MPIKDANVYPKNVNQRTSSAPAIAAGFPKVMIANTHRKRILGVLGSVFYAGSISHLSLPPKPSVSFIWVGGDPQEALLIAA
jgi:hypothetical protein